MEIEIDEIPWQNNQAEGEHALRSRKSVFIKAKFENFSKQIYSILIWEGVWVRGIGFNRLDFLRVDFSFSSYPFDYNQLKYNDPIFKYFESIKQSQMEALKSHTKNFTLLQKTLEREFKDIDFKNKSGEIKTLIREVEAIIEECYKEVFYGSRFSLNFGQEIYGEDEVASVRTIGQAGMAEKAVQVEWKIPKDSEVLESMPIIEPSNGVPTQELQVGDCVWLTLLSDQEKTKKKEFYGTIIQVVRDRKIGYRFLVDLGGNNYGDMEIMGNLNVRALRKADIKDDENPVDVLYAEEKDVEEKIDEMTEPDKIGKNYGFLYFLVFTSSLLLGLFYLFFIN